MGHLVKYLGRPYEKYNCFDIVKEFYWDNFKLDLKHYFEDKTVPPRKDVQSLIVSSLGDFHKVEKPEYGDLIIINLYGYSCHIGVYLVSKNFLHTLKNVGCCIEPLSKYKNIIEGFYRHKVRTL